MLLFLLGAKASLSAQQLPYDTQDLEDLLYRDESSILPEALAAQLPDFDQRPLNLNTASAGELESADIFTPYQVYHLTKYRETYGPLFSIHELEALPGFTPSLIRKIEPFVCLSNQVYPERKQRGQHLVLLDLKRSYPDPEMGREYCGSLLKTSLRIKSQLPSKLSLAMSYEKDAGETFLHSQKPQYLSGYLSFKGNKYLQQLVLGSYQLRQGLGLVNGAGFIHRPGNIRISRQSFSAIRPYSSLTESGYEQGIACQLGGKNFQSILWMSYHKFSVSPSVLSGYPGADQWLDYQNGSGLFRTTRELEGRDLAYRAHAGVQLLYRKQGFSLGILGGNQWIGTGKKAAKLMGKNPPPSLYPNLSLHSNWYGEKIQVFGELAACKHSSTAILLGASCQFNDFIKGSLLVHHYGRQYRGTMPSSYSSGSHIRNEQGLAFYLRMENSGNMIIHFTGELFQYLSPRYLTRVPSHGYRLDIALENPPKSLLQWKVRMVCKLWQTTPANAGSVIRPLLDSRVNRIDGQVTYNHEERFRWQSRFLLGYFLQQKNSSTGYALVQRLSLTEEHFRATAQLVFFHIQDWSNRIYLHEPGFYYSFNFPLYYGCGHRTTVLFTFLPVKQVAISLKISVILNRGKQSWESGLQVRLKL
jgi:hypothetical protein